MKGRWEGEREREGRWERGRGARCSVTVGGAGDAA